VDLGHQLPLKYFQYNHSTPPITTIDQSPGKSAASTGQAKTPIVLTNNPETMARITTGMRCQNLIIAEPEDCVCLSKSVIINSPLHAIIQSPSLVSAPNGTGFTRAAAFTQSPSIQRASQNQNNARCDYSPPEYQRETLLSSDKRWICHTQKGLPFGWSFSTLSVWDQQQMLYLCPRSSFTPPDGMFPLVVSAGLGPVATVLHGAPAAAAVPARVEEEPATPIVRTFSYPVQLFGG